jgi:hypothetical protein
VITQQEQVEMLHMKSHHESKSIEESLGVNYDAEKSPIVKTEPKSITVENKDDVEKDYNDARKSLKSLVETGEVAISGILRVAEEGDHPRAYEVVSQMIKTVADVNKDLMDIHKKVKDVRKQDTKLVQKNTTNNSFYVGSTSELQDLVNPERSQHKKITGD